MAPRIVIDAKLFVAALRSKNGASFQLVRLINNGKLTPVVSVPLVLEYEAAATRDLRATGLSASDIDALAACICGVAVDRQVHLVGRPFLRDPKANRILELAVASNAQFVVTLNTTDFQGAVQFAVCAIRPHDLVREIGELS